MRVHLKAALAALAMLFGVTVFATPGEARTVLYGGDGIVAVRDHGHGYRHGRGFDRGDRRFHGRPFYRGGPRYGRHGFTRDRGFYGRRHYRGERFYGRRHHYRDNGIVIRLR